MRGFWRWLSCGHGHHAWRLQAALELQHPSGAHHLVTLACRSCPRCGLVEVLE